MVENAEFSAETIAHNVLADMTGTGELKEYKPAFHGMMVCVGGRYGQAYIGSPGKMFGLPSFFAMFVKHFANIIYFVKVLGWNKVFSYLNHEFFQIRNKRSFLGGHFSNRSASFMTVPLRVYLGAYWLYEGIQKIIEGWLYSPQLERVFKGADAYYDSIINQAAATAPADAATSASVAADAAASASLAADAVTSASQAADAATSASAAAGQAAKALINNDIFGFIRLIFIDGGDAASNALKVRVAPLDWFMETFMFPSDTTQIVMQSVILFAEILIGLALVGGLFTTLSGAASLVLQTMFLTGTGLYMDTWWMAPAAFAVMFGAGRVLSLDYYVMPLLGKWWSKLKFVKKWYLYNG
jgi:NADH dehydrogenase